MKKKELKKLLGEALSEIKYCEGFYEPNSENEKNRLELISRISKALKIGDNDLLDALEGLLGITNSMADAIGWELELGKAEIKKAQELIKR